MELKHILIFLTFCVLAHIQAFDFAAKSLKLHNDYRADHGVPALSLDQEMTNAAEAYAKELAEKDIFEHSKDTGLGENLCMTHTDPVECVKMWYDEIKDYDFNNQGFTMKTGHFTQVVWKGTKKLGMGKANGKGGKIVVVARYKPSGNVEGDFENNVFKSKKGGVSRSVSFGFVPLTAVWLLMEFIV